MAASRRRPRIISSAIDPCPGGPLRFRSSPLKHHYHVHLRSRNRVRAWRQLSVPATGLRLPARPHRHLDLFIPSYFRGEFIDGLPASRSSFRRQDQDGGGVVVRRHAKHRRRHSPIADRDRARRCLHFFQPAANAETIIIASVVLIGVAMIVFTYFGGMEAVIWVEVVQLGIYIAGAVAAAIVLIYSIDGGFAPRISLARQYTNTRCSISRSTPPRLTPSGRD